MTTPTPPADDAMDDWKDRVEREGFAPCPTCGQYSHSIRGDRAALRKAVEALEAAHDALDVNAELISNMFRHGAAHNSDNSCEMAGSKYGSYYIGEGILPKTCGARDDVRTTLAEIKSMKGEG